MKFVEYFKVRQNVTLVPIAPTGIHIFSNLIGASFY